MIPVSRSTRRGRNPGKAVASAPGPIDVRVALRNSIERDFDIPPDLRLLSQKQAELLGLAESQFLADKIGVRRHTIYNWHRKYPDFPQIKAVLQGTVGKNAALWSVHEVFTWAAEAMKAGHIHKTTPQRKARP